MSDQLQADSVLCCFTGFKLSSPKTKLQNVGASDSPSKILIYDVPVEGVEDFIYLCNKRSSNGYYTDWMFYAGLDLPVQS